MRSMQWQLGILGTISVFVYRHREPKKNLCRGGRWQDLPNTDFQWCGMFFMRLCTQSSKKIFFKHYWPRTGLVKILRGRAQIADKFRRNYFACGKTNFIRTVFPNIPVTSQRPLQDGARELPEWPAPQSASDRLFPDSIPAFLQPLDSDTWNILWLYDKSY